MILCCIGCAIFGVTEVPTDGIHFDSSINPENDFNYMNAAETGTIKPNNNNTTTTTTTSIPNGTGTPIIIPQPIGIPNTTGTYHDSTTNDSIPPIKQTEPPVSSISIGGNNGSVHHESAPVQTVSDNALSSNEQHLWCVRQ
jgi:hypothetical protein